jgi:hypothetical protein
MPPERPLRSGILPKSAGTRKRTSDRRSMSYSSVSSISLTPVLVCAHESCSYLGWEIIDLQIWQMTNVRQNRSCNGSGRFSMTNRRGGYLYVYRGRYMRGILCDVQKPPYSVGAVIFECQHAKWVSESQRFRWCVGGDPIAKRVGVTPFSRPEGKIVKPRYPKLEGRKTKCGTRDKRSSIIAEEWGPTPSVMSWNLPKTSEIFGLIALSSIQRSRLKKSHTLAVVLTLTASFGLGGPRP